MPLNLHTPGINYSDGGTLRVSNAQAFTVQVFNGPCYYQLLLSANDMPGGGNWIDEVYLAPGYWNFGPADFNKRRCEGIRFRAAVAVQPPTITAN